MSQLIDNLNIIESVKTDIKSAIEAKGVDMTGISFPDYASKIGEISGGGGWDQKSLTEGTNEMTNLDNTASFVASGAFAHNKSIQTVNLPYATSVGASAFDFCWSLTNVNLPMCSYIGSSAFTDCYSLSQVSLPVCSYIDEFAFASCSSLTQMSLPVCSYIGSYAFKDCSTLNSIYLPVVRSIGSVCFNNCKSLSSIMLPECITLGNNVFTACSMLSTIVLPKLQTIGASVFRVLSNQPEYMLSLYMGGSDVVTTGSAVASTLFFGNVQKHIYVRASLIDMYQQHSIWGQINNVQWFNYEDSPYYTE